MPAPWSPRPPSLLVTQAEAGRILGLSKHSVQQIIAEGSLEPVRIAGLRHPRYRRADVEALAVGPIEETR